MYSSETRINSLSNKIASYIKEPLSFPKSTDPEVMGDDLQYSISNFIAEFGLALLPEPLQADKIANVIQDFNVTNGTSFSIQTFMDLGWLRLINEEYKIVSAVSTHLMRLDKSVMFGKTQTPKIYEKEINCLLEIYKSINANAKRALTDAEINSIIQMQNPALDASFFVSKKILSRNSTGDLYYHQGNRHTDYLKNRVISLAWFKITANGLDIAAFRKFLRFIDFMGRWPDKLSDYITHESIQQIRNFAEELLKSDPDLLYPEREVLNDKLDCESYKHDSFTPAIPTYKFLDSGPYEFFQQLEDFKHYDHDLFTHEESRNTYILLLRFIIQFEHSQHPYTKVKELLKEHKNPFVKAQLLSTVKSTFPEVLACFLNDLELSPVFFNVFDDLKVKDEWLDNNGSFEDNFITGNKIINELWMEAFKIYVDTASHSAHPSDYAKGFTAILVYIAKKVFSFNMHNYSRSSELHKIYRERYDTTIDILRSTRIDYTHSYPKPIEKPLLSAFLLPKMFEELNNCLVFPNQNEFLHLETANLDTYIELLR